MVDSGTYDRLLPDIVDVLVSCDGLLSQKFLAEVGVYVRIQKETRVRAKLSFYGAIVSALLGFLLIGVGIVLLWQGNLASGSLISLVGSAISAFITKTFLRIHEISLQQLNRFSMPALTEILSVVEKTIESLKDPNRRDEARVAAIEAFLRVLEKSKLNLNA